MFPDDFLVNDRWPAKDPSVIQLYSYPTPNGVKVSTMLEETGLPYEPHFVSLSDEDVRSPEFLSISPNNKIPAIVDPAGPDGPVSLFESGAILIHLAEKSGKFLPSGADRLKVIQWLMWQMGGLGPMLGQLGYFHAFKGKEIDDPRPKERFVNEARRLLGVLDTQLNGQEWVAGDYSIADMAIVPWLETIHRFYDAADLLGWDNFENLEGYRQRFMARDAVKKAWDIPHVPE
ncbi:GST-like protein [Sagittula marina]|uniref:GST-like protein n=1 Tax=Sagittula marina TaxID=943940 RepID=A0A7W6GSP3_9RHOB|nr:glutathione S-transferase N-terminal domain-containing protein [Sagittula marina]MBB3986656.1 GST-like protein [Sagittula marina]